ncbi:baseplate assembly protein [Formicincola oecophyllae]|uniref:Baseplate assembly protein n=1 Tax=Formicincola oecophyllae TaxID=2558361 RepID=A0A4Y6UCA2_9PROT|nr:baseplate J/gp47 family protein [Formicincola oecophyllae]QDH14077.1 baseplate assembly protein [Formicincola oecophyllae]
MTQAVPSAFTGATTGGGGEVETLYSPIDLSNLPAPQAITEVSAEEELSALLQQLGAIDPAFTNWLESDPAVKLCEAFAWRLAVEKQRRNEAIKAVMLAYATGADLDQLGANLNVKRLVLEPANPTTTPPTPAVMEGDDAFRARIQLSWEGYATAGSVGSYVFHAKSASAQVADVQVTSPAPGEVTLYVLAADGDGAAPQALLDTVTQAVTAERVRPLTDLVQVLPAQVVPYQITAQLDLYPGPDAQVVLKSAQDALAAYCASIRRIGYMVATSGIYAALQQGGVRNVTLQGWGGDLTMGAGQVGYCTATTITVAEAGGD